MARVRPAVTTTDFGMRLDEALAAKDWSQSRLASECGSDEGHISRIRSGARGTRMTPAMMFAIADALDVDARWLFLGKGTRRPDGVPAADIARARDCLEKAIQLLG